MIMLTPQQEAELKMLRDCLPYREWFIVIRPDTTAEYYNTLRRARNAARKVLGSTCFRVLKGSETQRVDDDGPWSGGFADNH